VAYGSDDEHPDVPAAAGDAVLPAGEPTPSDQPSPEGAPVPVAVDPVPDAYFRRLVDALADYAVILLDPRGIVLTWNPGAEAIKGFTAQEVVGTSFSRFYTPEALAVGHPERELELAAAVGRHDEEGWRMRSDGTRFWARVVITALYDDDGELFGFGKVTSDLTARKQAEEQAQSALELLRTTVRTDPLTGLLNRRGWTEALGREVALAERRGLPLCVAALDLDHFKHVNDEHGHEAGDRFLRQAGAAWRSCLRGSDVVARTGGEEFAVVFIDCDVDAAFAVLERMRGVTPEGATCSAGLAVWDGDESTSELVARADRALYLAKAQGRDRTVLATADEDVAEALEPGSPFGDAP
jgi:diguanylate cyclase (GGDEF)-like protein/PAS domain S-box-containing protein